MVISSLDLTFQEYFKMISEIKKIASMARIEINETFCKTCSLKIKNRLQNNNTVKNIKVYPENSLITFNFTSANELSNALNTLSEMGFTEKGDKNCKSKLFAISSCECFAIPVMMLHKNHSALKSNFPFH